MGLVWLLKIIIENMTEHIYHVDEEDKVIGKVTRKEAREKNLIHRGAIILVFNSKGEILVQKRSMTKDVFPGRYEMMVGGVCDYGEDYETTARRELFEEVGLKSELEYLFTCLYMDNYLKQVAAVYRTVSDDKLVLQEEEVDSAEFMSIEDLRQMMKIESFCDDAVDMFEYYMKECKNE